jgi:uncharacterized protein (UPF0332 family)
VIIDPAAELARAHRNIDQAWELRKDLPGVSMQQSYLAMFATARARAAVRDPQFQDRGHRQVQQHLTSLYRDDKSDQNPGKVLQRAYDWKQEEDYGIGGTGMPRSRTPEEARQAHSIALQFMERLKGDIVAEIGRLPELPSAEAGEDMHRRLSERGRTPPEDGGIGG